MGIDESLAREPVRRILTAVIDSNRIGRPEERTHVVSAPEILEQHDNRQHSNVFIRRSRGRYLIGQPVRQFDSNLQV